MKSAGRRQSLLSETIRDIRSAGRALRKSPGYLLASVLSLGIGIGAATTMFSVVEAVDLRQLPYRDPERLISIEIVLPSTSRICPGCHATAGGQLIEVWRQRASLLESVGLYQP